MVFYNKKKLPPPPRIPITIDEIPLIRVEEKRILGIIIDILGISLLHHTLSSPQRNADQLITDYHFTLTYHQM